MIENFSNLTKLEKELWYASLEVGDRVIVKKDNYGIRANTGYFEAEVKSITKTGRINVETLNGKYTFTKDGLHWGSRGDNWSRTSYELRQKDQFYINYKRKLVAKSIIKEGLVKLEDSFNSLTTIEETEKMSAVIEKAIKELRI